MSNGVMKHENLKQENLFNKVHNIFQRHVVAQPHDHVAFTLWTLHTHVFTRFGYTPRLMLLSPVENCGKTTVLTLLFGLTNLPRLTADTTPAALFRSMHLGSTLLIDEADNLHIQRNATLRAILNGGHQVGQTVERVILGEVKTFHLFTPVAIAAIGDLPPPLMSRAIVVRMNRAEPGARFERLWSSHEQMAEFATVFSEIYEWAARVNLDANPELPVHQGRTADNWRVLIAIADSLDRGEVARAAAVAHMAEDHYVNERILLLQDIRRVFNKTKSRRLPSQELVEHLKNLEDGEGHWSLSQKTLANTLEKFQIRPHLIWWPEDSPRGQQHQVRGYTRLDFEATWRQYAK
jgi:hypothetical protein